MQFLAKGDEWIKPRSEYMMVIFAMCQYIFSLFLKLVDIPIALWSDVMRKN